MLFDEVLIHHEIKTDYLEEEIQKMVKDAEVHADEDKKAKELVESKNQAEAIIHGSEKAIKDLGDKADKKEVEKVKNAIKELQDENFELLTYKDIVKKGLDTALKENRSITPMIL